jgi:Holliday junction resolvasome RuvABC DNA-binding subunit
VISELTGELVTAADGLARVRVGPVVVELLVPTVAGQELAEASGRAVTFATLMVIEGNTATSGNLIPRLIGFTSTEQRAFFQLLTKVKGVSTRKALRAMAVPHGQLAAAISEGDEKLLTSLPEIGKRTAAQMVTELRELVAEYALESAGGGAGRFGAIGAGSSAGASLSPAHRTALEILVQWGDRRADVEQWLAQVAANSPEIEEPEEIVKAVYEVKRGGR